MSKAAKQSIFILIILVLGSLGFAGYTIFEKQKVEKAKASLQSSLKKAKAKDKKQTAQIEELETELEQSNEEKSKLQTKIDNAEKQIEDLLVQVTEVTDDRDKWKRRIDTIQRERDELMAKVSQLSRMKKEQSSKKQESPQKEETKQQTTLPTKKEPKKVVRTTSTSPSDEEYWASVLREKAELEVQIGDFKEELSRNSIEIVDLKKQNSDLQLELEDLKRDKETIEREIKYKEDLVNNLSLELARSKNDKKFIVDRADKIKEENAELRSQVKSLIATKTALEKSIVRISEEKNKVEKQLGQTESLIQSKIDEIWEIKDSIDKTFESSKVPVLSNSVELPPIVVSTDDPDPNRAYVPEAKPGYNGKVVSINEENNFVIVDIGERSDIQLGDVLSVYHNDKYIARLEIIQVRKDISAADIKDQWQEIKVGDIVR